jgi:hypothetical protein
MLTLVGLLAFSIGSFSCASIEKKHEVKVECSISVDQSIVNVALVPMDILSIDSGPGIHCHSAYSEKLETAKTLEPVKLKKKDFKPDYISLMYRPDLSRNFYFKKTKLLSHYRRYKYCKGYSEPYNKNLKC